VPKQPALPGLRDAMKTKRARGEHFAAEMDAVLRWGRLLALIEPHYPKMGPKGGRPPKLLEQMLPVYFLQNRYALSAPMAEETRYDSEVIWRFSGIERGEDRISDETTILNFRHLLERHFLRQAIFAEVCASVLQRHHAALGYAGGCGDHRRAVLDQEQGGSARPRDVIDQEEQRLILSYEGTCPRRCRQRHIVQSGHVNGQAARQPSLRRVAAWRKNIGLGRQGLCCSRARGVFKEPGKVWGVMRKVTKSSDLRPLDERANQSTAMVRGKVEHPFRVIKGQFSHVNSCYPGLAKNRAQIFTLFAIGNLFLVRQRLMTCGRVCPNTMQPPPGRNETHEIRRESQIERAVSPLNRHLGTAEAVDQTIL
jgi:IS5 family transposase